MIFSNLPSPAEVGFAKAGNRFLLFGIMLSSALDAEPAHEALADLHRIAIARGAGISNSAWAADEEEFERLIKSAIKDGGPSLIAARIDHKPAVGTTDRDPVQIRERFMRGLGVKR